MRQSIEAHNQTQFSAEEPFFEQPVDLPQAEQVVKPKVPFFKRRKTIILIICAITLLLLFILFLVNLIVERNRRLGAAPDVVVATPTPAPIDSLVEQVEQLRMQWKAADPTQIELQPPAVDPTIRLDPAKR
jgi:hypothetical protein